MTNPKEQEIRERFLNEFIKPEMLNKPYVIADWWLKELHSDREAVREKIEAILFDAQFQLKANPDDFMQWLSQRLLSPNK